MTKQEKAIKFFQDMEECTYGNLEEVDMAIHALEQELNVIEELEKIKEEFDKEIEIKKKQDYSRDFFIGVCDCLMMIEDRIEELKGDSNAD